MLFVLGSSLAFIFIVSHNFEGVDKINHSNLESSCSYGGKLACFITGGLNYQIEHHLFPKVSHIYYPEIQPMVMEVCKKYNVKYTYYPSFYENIKSTYKHFKEVYKQALRHNKL